MKLALIFSLLGVGAYEACKYTGALNGYVAKDSILWSYQGLGATAAAFLVLGVLLAAMLPKKKKA